MIPGHRVTVTVFIELYVGSFAHRSPSLPGMKISLPRHDLLGRKSGLSVKGEGEGEESFAQWAFIGFNLHRNIGKAHQSFSGSKVRE